MNWQQFLIDILNSEAMGLILISVVGAAATWIMRRLKLSDKHRQQAEDALRGGVEWVWENRAKIAKQGGVKLTAEQREAFRRMATDYARELARDKGIDLEKALMSQEVIDGLIHEIISARRQGESKPTAAEVAKAKLAALAALRPEERRTPGPHPMVPMPNQPIYGPTAEER